MYWSKSNEAGSCLKASSSKCWALSGKRFAFSSRASARSESENTSMQWGLRSFTIWICAENVELRQSAKAARRQLKKNPQPAELVGGVLIEDCFLWELISSRLWSRPARQQIYRGNDFAGQSIPLHGILRRTLMHSEQLLSVATSMTLQEYVIPFWMRSVIGWL